MYKSVFAGIGLIVGLYLLWVWIVFAEPPFADMEDWQKTDFTLTSITLQDIVEGGPGKDGIPSIDQPKLESIEQAQAWLNAREPVVVYSNAHGARAYPLQILMYHEIVNDRLGDQSIAVTYCPLCNAAMVFSRHYADEVFEFGVSGKVYNSNLVMYDRQTESWWLQFTGQGVVGKYTNAILDLLPSQIVSFMQFKQAYPKGRVLSRKTGFNKKYGVNPYAHYDSRQLPIVWFYGKPFDNRLPAMERALGVVVNEQATAFPLSELNQSALVHTHVSNVPILIVSKAGMASAVDKRLIKESKDVLAAAAFSRQVNGKQLDFELIDNNIVDKQTRSVWNMFGQAVSGEFEGKRLQQVDRGVYFAFVWLDFYSHSVIFTNDSKQ